MLKCSKISIIEILSRVFLIISCLYTIIVFNYVHYQKTMIIEININTYKKKNDVHMCKILMISQVKRS